MVHPQVLSNVKHKCFCFVCRSFVRARATEQPSYHTSFQISACLDSTRRALPRLATTRFVSTPPCRDTTPHASYHTVLRFQFFRSSSLHAPFVSFLPQIARPSYGRTMKQIGSVIYTLFLISISYFHIPRRVL